MLSGWVALILSTNEPMGVSVASRVQRLPDNVSPRPIPIANDEQTTKPKSLHCVFMVTLFCLKLKDFKKFHTLSSQLQIFVRL